MLPVMCQACCTSSHPSDLSKWTHVRPVKQARVPRGPSTGTGHHPVSLQPIVFLLICRVRFHWLHASQPRILPSLHGMKKNKSCSLHCTGTTILRPRVNETFLLRYFILSEALRLKSPQIKILLLFNYDKRADRFDYQGYYGFWASWTVNLLLVNCDHIWGKSKSLLVETVIMLGPDQCPCNCSSCA